MATFPEDSDSMQVHVFPIALEMLMTPPGSPRKASLERDSAAKCRRKSRLSLSDWWGDGEDSDCVEESDDDIDSEANHSTTASEVGDAPRTPPRSPTKRLSKRKSSPKKKAAFLPQIFYVGDDWDEVAAEWAPSPTKAAQDRSSGVDDSEVELQFPEEAGSIHELNEQRRKRHSTCGRFFTGVAAALETCLQETYVEQHAEVGNVVEYETAEVVDTDKRARPLILNIPRCMLPGAREGKFPSFESGLKGHLKELLASQDGSKDSKRINVMVLAFQGKKRIAAPEPEEFSRRLQGLVTKIEGQEGNDQQNIIETSQKYTKIFEKVMGLSSDETYGGPSLDGGLDAVVELLDDVRTGAWNMAAFIFRR